MSEGTTTLAELAARIGEEIGVSGWFDITQDMIDRFADVTRDHQFIHVDPERAKASPFGGTVAHGFLTASMLSALAIDALPKIKERMMGVNYGFDRLRFVSPVRAGGRIRGRFVLKSARQRAPGEFQLTYLATVEQDGAAKPALTAEWLTLVYTGAERAA